MNNFQEFNKTNQSIAQLKELQVTRRLTFLEDQKQRREEQFSFLQDLKKIAPSLKLTKHQEKLENEWKREASQSTSSAPKKPVFNEKFRNILMFAEWMWMKPNDLDNYLLVPLSKGVRCSVSVGEFPSRVTSLHLKNGQLILETRTNLPHNTTLDCIYDKKLNTIYIIDALLLFDRDLVKCDTAFRRFWLQSQLEGVCKSSLKSSEIKLQILPDYDCKNYTAVNQCFQKYPMFDDEAKLDGFLFYHKESIYTSGETPLVLWLFPFMIDEVLTMFRVNPIYNNQKPSGYKNYIDHIEKFNERQEKKNQKRKGEGKDQKNEAKKARRDDFTEDVGVDDLLKF